MAHSRTPTVEQPHPDRITPLHIAIDRYTSGTVLLVNQPLRRKSAAGGAASVHGIAARRTTVVDNGYRIGLVQDHGRYAVSIVGGHRGGAVYIYPLTGL